MNKTSICICIILLSIPFIASSQTEVEIIEVKKEPKYEFKIITTIESIVSNGIGRSRMIVSDAKKDYQDYTTSRNEDKSNRKSRKSIRVKDFEETKLLNFYNLGGIRFQNIASNDALVSSKIIEMHEKGWNLVFVTSGVESTVKGESGIFITRYIFKKAKE